MNKLDQVIFEIAHEKTPANQAESAAARVRQRLFGETAAGPQRLRSCSDFQALIPAYLNHTLSAGRALLLQDHTRECAACRNALRTARSGAGPVLIRPVTPPSRTIPSGWAIAAAAVITVGLTGWVAGRAFVNGRGLQTTVQTVSGILYAVSDRGSTPIFAGREIASGEHVRTAKASTAIVRLGDGSLIEMSERAELSVVPESRGANIRLDRGNIIVQAAKQRSGTLNVLTPDCTVSVKGTIFAVSRGTKGTRVSVVEGAVKVEQGAQTSNLKPGDQVTTDASLTATPVKEEIAWSRDSGRYVSLLSDFKAIQKGLEAMPSPGLRYQSRLLSYVSSDAVLYAAIPNISTALGQAQRLFNDRLQQSDVLRAWWEEQKDGPKLQEMVNTLRLFTEYLGDEIVFTIDSNGNGEYSDPLIMAEVKQTGLDAFLSTQMQRLGQQGAKNLPEIVRLEASSGESSNARYWRGRRRASSHKESALTIGLNDGLIVVAWNREQLDEIAQRAAGRSEPFQTSLLRNAQSAYQNGAGWLMCVNMEHIARNSVGGGRGKHGGPKLPKGLDAMRNLIVERKDIAGRTENQATLTFEGARSGFAAWLAEPSPMGSLDFVSPNATLAVSMALRAPQWMLSDVFQMIGEQDPNFEENLRRFNRNGLQLSPALAQPLGGEFTFALDGPLLPLPSWKFAVEVYSPDRLQWAIEQLINGFNSDSTCPDCKINLAKEQSGDRTYYTLTTEKTPYEIDYVYVDGYLLAAPNRALLNRAIQNRETGYVLSHAEAFRAALPRDGRLNFSALLYHNTGSAIAPIANQIGSANVISPAQREAIQSVAANSAPGLIYAYGEPERITVATGGTFFGLDLNTLALPNLVKMAAPSKHRHP